MRRKVGMECFIAVCATLVVLPVAAASVVGAPAETTRAAVSAQGADAAMRNEKRGDDVADSHLRFQFALHRTSRYLYNPPGVISLAASADQTTPLEH
jgi:hypothetical protein